MKASIRKGIFASRLATRKTWRWMAGPLTTLACIVCFQALEFTPFRLPDPMPVEMLTVVYAAFIGGIIPGLISAGLAFLHGAATLLEPGQQALASQDNTARLMVALVLPGAALMVGHLRNRFERAERRHSEEIHHQARERLDMVARATTDSVWDWDITTDQVWWSEGICVLARNDAEHVGRNSRWWSDHIHPEDRGRVMGKLARFLTARDSKWQDEYRFLRADGTVADIVDRGHAIRGEDGTALRMVGAMSDVTEQKQADLALRHSEAKFRAAFDNVMDAMVIFDDSYCYLDANPAACEIFGLSRDQIVGRRIEELMAPDTGGADEEFLRRMHAGTRLTGEWVVKRQDGTVRHVEYVTSADFLPGLHLCVARDMTARRALMEQMSQAQKMEAIGRLAGGVAHDFNNLLTVIRGYADFQLAVLPASSTARADLAEIARAADRAASLTRQLLAFSRRQVLEMRVLDLNAVVSGIMPMIRRLAGEMISLEFLPTVDLRAVMADPGQLEQVLLNLAINARDAMPRGGRITITTSNVDVPEGMESHHALPDGPYVALDFKDDGCGMDESTLAHVFEPFFTTKERDRGTGLGMSTVYGIVKQSGGDVQVQSRRGYGTTVRALLPRAQADSVVAVGPALKAAADVDAASCATTGREVIMLVEDDPAVRELARRALSSEGYRIIVADNGPSAISAVRASSAQIDMLLTDVVMPGMSGKDLYEALAVSLPRLKVLYTSGYAEEAVTHHGVSREPASLLPKPFTTESLRRKVREVLGKTAESLDRGQVGI